jgi:hypothetical protein
MVESTFSILAMMFVMFQKPYTPTIKPDLACLCTQLP